MTEKFKTYAEVVQACYGLPHPNEHEFAQMAAPFYRFRLRENWDDDASGNYVTVGWILLSTVTNMPWTDKFKVEHHSQTVDIPYAAGEVDFENQAIAEQLELARAQGIFAKSKKLEDEFYRVLGVDRIVRIARGGSGLFGIQSFGIQMTGYTFDERTGEMKIWVPKRSSTRMAHPGKMDNTVGGAANADEDHFQCMLREAREEAALPEKWLQDHAHVVGTISYLYMRDVGALGALNRSLQFVYDVELPSYMVPQPADDEVEEFLLWTVPETLRALKDGQFKPNSAATLIDFFIRHGYISTNDEPDLETVVSYINRRPCL
ncbi:unnamed protein product [Periconia digitata]|uniref:Nudix hydrolase domain-containing protein n=1 Tax=Periconia digitata TaxID=1303443 RepID=A0A9W4UIP3_9PLEO|nr:unnamed protein product [Periconia digitata]